MPRLIDADVVKKNIDEWLDCVGTALIGKGLSYTWELEGCIDDAPTIDPESLRPNGRWVYNDEYVLWLERYVCSVCNRNALSDGDYRHELSDYCPHCGAKMDLEEDDG